MKCARLRAELALAFALVLLSAVACKRNHPPSIPDVTGRLTYRPGDTARLFATSTDEDDDSLSYLFAWVDSASAVWSANYRNGVPAAEGHVYSAPDTCAVRVRAKDKRGAQSDWSAAETLRVGLFPPGTPTRPAGPSSWQTGDTYRCSTHAASPYAEPVLIEYDWDGTPGGWRQPVPSDSLCVGTHLFYVAGTYHIRARAGDTTGLASPWSDSIAVAVGWNDSAPPATPGAPFGPDSTWQGAVYTCSVVTTARGRVRYVMNWMYDIDTGDVSYGSGETAAVTHAWSDAGLYYIKARAILDADPSKASGFSQAKSVKVNPNNAPVIDSVSAPTVVMKDVETLITVYGHDPDGDSLKAILNWPAGDTMTELTPSPCKFTASHVFTVVETARVIVRLRDRKGAESISDTIRLWVVASSGVKWYWQNRNGGAMLTSALVAFDGRDEVVMSDCWDDQRFYAVRVSNGRTKRNQTTKYGEDDFSGGPALCTATGNVIAGADDGELYALSVASLSHSWRWPDLPETLETGIVWGAPAISGYDIYIGHDDDMLYKFTDAGTSVSPGPTYDLDSATVCGAPAIDADGSVYIGTDSGYLIKLDADLLPCWRLHLEPIGPCYSPIIGSDGTVYAGTDSSRLYAVNAGGTVKWTAALEGVGARPALGQSALFVGTDQGTVYSIDPATGAVNWQKSLGQFSSFNTTPIVAANGYLYIQDDDDVLYCLNQVDGTRIWACDCNSYLPGGGRRARPMQLTDYDPGPSITSTGDIIVVGLRALFCVAGYAEGPLDPTAAWPKWQKDLSNTGKR